VAESDDSYRWGLENALPYADHKVVGQQGFRTTDGGNRNRATSHTRPAMKKGVRLNRKRNP